MVKIKAPFGIKIITKRSIFRLFVLYGLLIIAMFYFQKHMIFYPTHNSILPPKDMNVEEVYFTTSDDVKLHGWWYQTNRAEHTVIYFHGNAGNISDRVELLDLFEALHVNALLFDYRGYGKSTSTINTEEDTYRDGKAAWQYVTTQHEISQEEIVLWGRSIGSSIALETALNRDIAGIILDSPFYNMTDLAQAHYWFLPVKYFIKFHYNNHEKITQIKAPSLFIHSRDDEIIPLDHGKRLFELANKPKEFVEVAGTHNVRTVSDTAKYIDELKAFFKAL